MKIQDCDDQGNVKIRAKSEAMAVLNLKPFQGSTFLSARGCLANQLGQGWWYLCCFGQAGVEAVLRDLLDVEAAEFTVKPIKAKPLYLVTECDAE